MSTTRMLINYVPGEECRVALVEDGRLDELHAESTSHASRVGNIYVGVVANIESAIQAAFVDFGVKQHGFLHVTDLHPQYFPGEDAETTERVGHKTPRRDRPPMQRCLKKGQQVVVQVLKEGVGTKGPSLTSYLSIPGQHIVMMPQMDRVGVSRRVEDEQTRRKMREVLDQLDLPEGFGFIIRTSGLDRTKAELKRDLAYLQRLWKDMEDRQAMGKGPRLLYTESDLLVRALRDFTTTSCDEIVIDNELALSRGAKFRKIVAPRSQTALLHYTGGTPIFHAYGIEEQITNIHSREVPLPSGGRLVIDQTEALVAIDVNSGKSRSARDAETNAYKTNLEAVDEICRQLKLRDLGGVIIHDLIDMREGRHRREIEGRFRDRLKRDRAKSTILPISNFGILEMTRQRIRSSHETIHFSDCPTCRGRGLVQRADSVAGDALRSVAALLDQPNVHRVELVVSPRVAGDLLSNRRRNISRLEKLADKHVDVRVSETLSWDRVAFYAYDANDADVDIDALPKSSKNVKTQAWSGEASGQWAIDLLDEGTAIEEQDDSYESDDEQPTKSKKKRRRRRGRRGKKTTDEQAAEDTSSETEPGDEDSRTSDGPAEEPVDSVEQDSSGPPSETSPETPAETPPGKSKKKRRRGRRGKKTSNAAASGEAATVDSNAQDDQPTTQSQDEPETGEDTSSVSKSKKRRRSRRKKKSESAPEPGDAQGDVSATPSGKTTEEDTPATDLDNSKPKKKRSRRRSKKKAPGTEVRADQRDAQEKPEPVEPTESKSRSRRKKTTPRAASGAETAPPANDVDSAPAKKKRTRSKKITKKAAAESNSTGAISDSKPKAGEGDDGAAPRRTLYASRRKLSASERARLGQED